MSSTETAPLRRLTSVVAAVLSASLLVVAISASSANASHVGTHITGTAGEVVDPSATGSNFYLRYVGDPAPAGYSHTYQWDDPFITADPSSGPVTFEGTLDFSGRADDNSVSMIGLIDKAVLEAGNTGWGTGAYVYVNNRPDGTVRVGPTDGNAGGEFVQTFHFVPEATADAGPIGVTVTIDGTAVPATCAAPADLATADGCITVDLDGFAPLTDSYGSVTGAGGPAEEFSTGAVPGWDVFPADGGLTGYDLMISPAEVALTSKDQCKDGGWESFGFSNQGQCVRFVETGEDSR